MHQCVGLALSVFTSLGFDAEDRSDTLSFSQKPRGIMGGQLCHQMGLLLNSQLIDAAAVIWPSCHDLDSSIT
jgi:hypothetical protein